MYELPTQEEANDYLSANGPWDMQEHFGITKYDANRFILAWARLTDTDLEFLSKEND